MPPRRTRKPSPYVLLLIDFQCAKESVLKKAVAFQFFKMNCNSNVKEHHIITFFLSLITFEFTFTVNAKF